MKTGSGPIKEGPQAESDRGARLPADPLLELEGAIRRLRESAADYYLATVDAIRVQVRNRLLSLALLTFGAFFALGVMMAGVVLLLLGLSRAIAGGLKSPEWGGFLVVGVIATLFPLAGLLLRVRTWKRRRFEATRTRYEDRHAKQRP